MTDLDCKRAQDRARQARLTAEGRRPSRAELRRTQTPEQQAKTAARQERHLQWRAVGREWDRLMRLPADVVDDVIRRAKEKTA